MTILAYYSLGGATLAATFALTSSFLSGVHRLLLLVMIFLMTGGLYLLYDFYFLGLSYIIVYCGAIAIIFLFVLMMISLDGVWQKRGNQGFLAAFIVGALALGASSYGTIVTYFYPVLATIIFPIANDIFTLAIMIYLAYPISLLLIGMVLFVVLLGVIRLVVK